MKRREEKRCEEKRREAKIRDVSRTYLCGVLLLVSVSSTVSLKC